MNCDRHLAHLCCFDSSYKGFKLFRRNPDNTAWEIVLILPIRVLNLCRPRLRPRLPPVLILPIRVLNQEKGLHLVGFGVVLILPIRVLNIMLPAISL